MACIWLAPGCTTRAWVPLSGEALAPVMLAASTKAAAGSATLNKLCIRFSCQVRTRSQVAALPAKLLSTASGHAVDSKEPPAHPLIPVRTRCLAYTGGTDADRR
jgi:hypothetical protein